VIRKPKVISIGANTELLRLRGAILKCAGFNVFSTSDPKQAVIEIQAADCGALLLCYSLADSVRQQIAREFRETHPGAHIVAITTERLEEPPEDADIVVYGIEGPETLISAIRGSGRRSG